jgi:hypothetical protein
MRFAAYAPMLALVTMEATAYASRGAPWNLAWARRPNSRVSS